MVELFSFVAGAASAALARSGDAAAGGTEEEGHDEDAPPAWIRLDLTEGAPEARKGHAAAALGNWLVVAGGRRVQTAAPPPASNSNGGSLWRGGGGLLLRRRGSAGAEAGASPSKGNGSESNSGDDDGGLFSDAFVLDCGGGRVRWRRASGGLGLLGGEEGDDDDDDDDEVEGDNGDDSLALRREFASLISLPAIDGGCLLLLGGGDGKGRLLAGAQRATPAVAAAAADSHFESSGPFAGRAPPPPPPPLAPLALRGFARGRSGSSRWKKTPGREIGSSGPGTPLSAASESDDGGGGGAGAFSEQEHRRRLPSARLCPLPLPPLSLPVIEADPAAEAKMDSLRARLGCCCRSSSSDGGGGGGGRDSGGRAFLAPPSSSPAAPSSPASFSRLGERARSSAELASLCAKETSELTMGDLRLLLAAVKRGAGEEARGKRKGQQQRDEGGGNGGDGGKDDKDENEIDLFCSVELPEALRLGQAQALQQAAAAVLRLL